MKTEEGNKLIAEFMGMTLGHPDKEETRWKDDWFEKLSVDGGHFESGSRHKHLLFHNSWDWLMPVVEKILSLQDEDEDFLFNVTIDANKIVFYDNIDYRDILFEENGASLVEMSYNGVLRFIEFYNKNK